jgi:hypothetical protein
MIIENSTINETYQKAFLETNKEKIFSHLRFDVNIDENKNLTFIFKNDFTPEKLKRKLIKFFHSKLEYFQSIG